MPRYVIYGTENPEAIERTVEEALTNLGWEVHRRTSFKDHHPSFKGHTLWDRLTLFCTDAYELWADLRVQMANHVKEEFGVLKQQK